MAIAAACCLIHEDLLQGRAAPCKNLSVFKATNYRYSARGATGSEPAPPLSTTFQDKKTGRTQSGRAALDK